MSVLISGPKVILRDYLPSDIDPYIRWITRGEWRKFDAPWEGMQDALTKEQESKVRQTFLESCVEELPSPRKRAIIITTDKHPLGWVNRYGYERFPKNIYVGINICEDHFLNSGIGTEALKLWVDYLFSNSDFHRISLNTWSFNPRMIRVAEKVGFRFEGAQKEMIEWQDEWLDYMHFGILRTEWEKTNSN